MTSKEALGNIRSLFIGSPIDFSKHFEAIEKDLEVLEILKKHKTILCCCDKDIELYRDYQISINHNDKDYEKVKEWLENE